MKGPDQASDGKRRVEVMSAVGGALILTILVFYYRPTSYRALRRQRNAERNAAWARPKEPYRAPVPQGCVPREAMRALATKLPDLPGISGVYFTRQLAPDNGCGSETRFSNDSVGRSVFISRDELERAFGGPIPGFVPRSGGCLSYCELPADLAK
jgi:hypothetical protein